MNRADDDQRKKMRDQGSAGRRRSLHQPRRTRVREEDSIVVRTEKLLSAAFAALVFAAPIAAQQPPVTAVTLDRRSSCREQSQPSIIAAEGTVSVDDATIRARKGAFLPSLSVSSERESSVLARPIAL